MAQQAVIQTMLDYHLGLGEKLWASVDQLSDAQFVQDIPYSVGSIRNQLVHLVTIETRWLRGLQGDANARAFQLEPAEYPDRKAVRELWEAHTQMVQEVVKKFDGDMLDQPAAGMNEPAWQILMHLVIHGVDHRAQILRGLHDLGVATFPQDFIIYLWQKGNR